MKTLSLEKLLLTCIFFTALTCIQAAVIRVNVFSPCTSGCDGATWATAYTSLQAAIDAAAPGDELWVSEGTYLPTYEYGGSGDRFKTIFINKDIALYGGFTGSETMRSQRDWVNHVSTLSGDVGVFFNSTDNSYHVVLLLNCSAAMVLDGFKIQDGYANGAGNDDGAGLLVFQGAPLIANCIVSNNHATDFGGGVYNYQSVLRMENTAVYGNLAANGGGGIFNYGDFFNPAPTYINCTIASNNAAIGGSIYNSNMVYPVFTNCIIWGNAGGINESGNTASTVTYSIVQGGLTGTGNLNADPHFVNLPAYTTAPFLHADLHTNSMCAPQTDHGTATGAPATDFDNNPRPVHNGYDMGIYEYQDPIISGGIIYVKADATGANNGTSWANAYTNFQSALDYVNACDGMYEVWVAAGSYKPAKDIYGNPSGRTQRFFVYQPVQLYGGFNGTETMRSQRNWTANPTILDGDIGIPGTFTDNAYNVITFNLGNDPTAAVLDGFHITNGNGNGSVPGNERGGGIQMLNITLRVSNCQIVDNFATLGGGVYAGIDTDVEFQSCTFMENSAADGGAIFGDGIFSFLRIRLTDVTINNNACSGSGGGIQFLTEIPNSQSFLKLQRCAVRGNACGAIGGGINFKASDHSNAPFELLNCLFSGNSSVLHGSALACEGSNATPTFQAHYTTVSGNKSSAGAPNNAAIAVSNSNIFFENSIFWGNNGGFNLLNNSLTFFSHSTVEGGIGGNNIFSFYPNFVDPAHWSQAPTIIGDYHLKQYAFPQNNADAGIAQSVDLEGNPRPVNGGYDQGCYEYQGPPAGASRIYVDITSGGGNGSSWATAFNSLTDGLYAARVGNIPEIWVANGIYAPTSDIWFNPYPTNNREKTFPISANLAIYGSFAGNETSLNERVLPLITGTGSDWSLLNGDIGVINNQADNTYHVVWMEEAGNNIHLDGFRVWGGYGNGSNMPYTSGGGISISNSSPVIRNCQISNCSATYGGGIAVLQSGDPALTNVAFILNNASSKGGGFYASAAVQVNPIFNEVVFNFNQSTSDGGGVCIETGPGALSTSVFNRCSFVANVAYTGAAYRESSAAGSTINSSFTNCRITGNSSVNYPVLSGQHLSSGSTATYMNCTIAANKSTSGGFHVINNSGGHLAMTNSIVWGNSAGIEVLTGSTATINYSDVQGDIPPGGSNNLSAHPGFIQLPNYFSAPTPLGDYHLRTCALTVNAGTDTGAPNHDIENSPRPIGSGHDMGAYENQVNFNATRLYVNDNATGSNDGLSWNNALTDLTNALQMAHGCPTVVELWVAEGTYKPKADAAYNEQPANPRDKYFNIEKSVAIYGGFNGTETMLTERNWLTNNTILDGDINFAGLGDNAYHVVRIAGNSHSVRVDGFGIRNGQADGMNSNGQGGGIYGENARLTVANCDLSNNRAIYGGGLYYVVGAGYTSMSEFDNCTFSQNVVINTGGGFYFEMLGVCHPVVTDCTISDNDAGVSGAGGCIQTGPEGDTDPLFERCRFRGNHAVNGGGALLCNMGEAASDELTMTNCILSGNLAQMGGGISFVESTQNTTLRLNHCTVAANASFSPPNAAIHNFGNDLIVTNSIVWGNSGSIENQNGGSATVTYSIIQGGHSGTGNLNTDPRFVNLPGYLTTPTIAGDFQLRPCSFAIDAGTNTGASATDFDQHARPALGGYDMGAYEVQTPFTATRLYVNDNASGLDNGLSWANALTNLGEALQMAEGCPSVGEVWVASGTYTPTYDTNYNNMPADPRTRVFALSGNLQLYGGFAGTESSPAQRNLTAHISTLDGGIGGSSLGDNCYHVVQAIGQFAPRIDGFHIQYGNANGSNANALGGGVYGQNSNLTIAQCHIKDNSAIEGGGICLKSEAGNTTQNIVEKTRINENDALLSGGGLCLLANGHSGLQMTDLLLESNNAATGAGAYIGTITGGSTSPVITRCQFKGNTAVNGLGGGALMCEFGHTTPDEIIMTNCLLTGNVASNGSGIKILENGQNTAFRLINCTLAANRNLNFPAQVIHNSGSDLVCSNSIVWGNSGAFQNFSGGTAAINYSLVQGGYSGTGNLNTSPRFIDLPNFESAPTTAGDFHVLNCSFTTDAGTATGAPATDLSGNPRPVSGAFDLGVYEVQTPFTATRLYVKANASGMNNGLSWANALTDLNHALEMSAGCPSIGEVWVGAGTYFPAADATHNYTPADPRTKSFAIPGNLQVYGGFSGTETAVNQRNISMNQSLLLGEIGGASTADNSYHVVEAIGNFAPRIDGFNILNGNANGTGTNAFGGGVFALNSNLTISQCNIALNVAAEGGGGFYHKTTAGNTTDFVVEKTKILLNTTPNWGGGLYALSEGTLEMLVNESIIEQNQAGAGAGAAVSTGGVGSANPIFDRCQLRGNNANDGGGLLLNLGFGSPDIATLTNCILSGNKGMTGAATSFNENGQPCTLELTNCTVAANHSQTGAGVLRNGGNDLVLKNTIVWGNSNAIELLSSAAATVTYSDIQGGYSGTGNLNKNPKFIDLPNFDTAPTTVGDFHVHNCSFTTDVGTATGAPDTDLSGNPRPVSGAFDLGVYEVQTPFTATRLYVKANASGMNDGLSWANALTNLNHALEMSAGCPSIEEVWVGAGIYFPAADATHNYNPADPRTKLFPIPGNLRIYGGFSGTETAVNQRNIPMNQSFLLGEIGSSSAADNSYHVVEAIGNFAPRIDGFNILNGNANGTGTNAFGGGVFALNSNLTISQCNIALNVAAEGGGGFYHKTTAGNTTDFVVEKTKILLNTTPNWGGGLYALSEGTLEMLVNESIIEQNQAGAGAGVAVSTGGVGSANPIFDRCQLHGNNANDGGGLFLNLGFGSPDIATLTNCILSGNKGMTGAATSFNENGQPCTLELTNCTVAANHSQTGVGVLRNGGNDLVMKNTIVWGNSNAIELLSSAVATVTYSDIQGGYSGMGNLNNDPLFTDLPPFTSAPVNTGDFLHLAGSPIIDAGTSAGAPGVDIRQFSRPAGGGFDMGAYESGSALPIELLLFQAAYREKSGDVLLTWITTAEQNADLYEIERSYDGTHWVYLGFVKAGNDTYHFTDDKPLQGFNYYRLKMKDKDGTHVYSPIRHVAVPIPKFALTVFPNPATEWIMVKPGEAWLESTVKIFDVTGRTVIEKHWDANAPEMKIEVSGLPSGAYQVVLESGQRVSEAVTFVR